MHDSSLHGPGIVCDSISFSCRANAYGKLPIQRNVQIAMLSREMSIVCLFKRKWRQKYGVMFSDVPPAKTQPGAKWRRNCWRIFTKEKNNVTLPLRLKSIFLNSINFFLLHPNPLT